jgi:hypothetical protein
MTVLHSMYFATLRYELLKWQQGRPSTAWRESSDFRSFSLDLTSQLNLARTSDRNGWLAVHRFHEGWVVGMNISTFT